MYIGNVPCIETIVRSDASHIELAISFPNFVQWSTTKWKMSKQPVQLLRAIVVLSNLNLYVVLEP